MTEAKKKAIVEEFLVENGYDLTQLTSDKEKIEALWNISLSAGVDKDCEIIKFDKIDKTGMSKEEYLALRDKYITNIHNFEFREINARLFIRRIKFQQKETRKLKRKETFQKVLSIFKSKKR